MPTSARLPVLATTTTTADTTTTEGPIGTIYDTRLALRRFYGYICGPVLGGKLWYSRAESRQAAAPTHEKGSRYCSCPLLLPSDSLQIRSAQLGPELRGGVRWGEDADGAGFGRLVVVHGLLVGRVGGGGPELREAHALAVDGVLRDVYQRRAGPGAGAGLGLLHHQVHHVPHVQLRLCLLLAVLLVRVHHQPHVLHALHLRELFAERAERGARREHLEVHRAPLLLHDDVHRVRVLPAAGHARHGLRLQALVLAVRPVLREGARAHLRPVLLHALPRVHPQLVVVHFRVPAQHEPRPLHLALVEGVGPAGGALLIAPVRRHPVLRHLVHALRADLHLQRAAVGHHQHGVQALVAVRLGAADVVLGLLRPPQAVDRLQHLVALRLVAHHHADGAHVEHLLQLLALLPHLLRHAEHVLVAAGDVTEAHPALLERALHRRDVPQHGLRVAPLRQRGGQLAVLLRGLEAHAGVLEVRLEPPDAEAVGERDEEAVRLRHEDLGVLCGEVVEGGEVAELVGELDHHDVDVGHDQEHRAEPVELHLVELVEGGGVEVVEGAELAHPDHHVHHLVVDEVAELVLRHHRVLQAVVEQPGGHHRRAQPVVR
mmetsp:Transcript_32615/g.71256  ORF Transcript_32615/g.71256 Transcript_32615/m.71256 type:complete len:602 (-) Transcript_32615:1045-2850(-)